jgi:hypothetical protein
LWIALREQSIKETHGDIMTVQKNIAKTKKSIMAYFWWPGTDGQIDQHI